LLLYSSKPSLGVFQLAGHLISYTIDLAPSSFLAPLPGIEEEEAPISNTRSPVNLAPSNNNQVFWRRCRGLKKKKLPYQVHVPPSTWYHQTAIKFSGAVAGEEMEDLCKGSFSHTHPLLCFKFCFTLFLLASFYIKNPKKN
jgi:hypothetical protein